MARAGEDPARAGQAIYSRPLLAVYDAFVYGFNMPVGWRCSKRRMLDLYEANFAVNRHSLAVTAARLERYAPAVRQGNALEPWPVEPASFHSVALTHIVHCLPGPIAAKAPVFDHAAVALAPAAPCSGRRSSAAGSS